MRVSERTLDTNHHRGSDDAPTALTSNRRRHSGELMRSHKGVAEGTWSRRDAIAAGGWRLDAAETYFRQYRGGSKMTGKAEYLAIDPDARPQVDKQVKGRRRCPRSPAMPAPSRCGATGLDAATKIVNRIGIGWLGPVSRESSRPTVGIWSMGAPPAHPNAAFEPNNHEEVC
jgi:hypothetical protein